MKIAIIGAGISGLTTYIALKTHLPRSILDKCSIKIYEKYDSKEKFSSLYNHNSNDDNDNQDKSTHSTTPKNVGVGIGIQPNGMKVLKKLNSDLHDQIVKLGFPLDEMVMRTEGGYEIARMSMMDGRTGGRTVLVSRLGVVECLLGVVEGKQDGEVVVYRDVKSIVAREGEKPMLIFGDGSSSSSPPGEVVDLVIGADGIRSVVREAVIGGGDSGENGYEPVYDGYCGVGGILDAPVPTELRSNPAMMFTLSSTGIFGYSGISGLNMNKMIYWSLYDTDLPTRGTKPSPEAIILSLRSRHGKSPDPLIQTALEKANLNTIWPVFLLPKLPRWGRNGCVLVGDAAHALPPNSGQGGSQGIEDAYTLALLLSAHLQNSNDRDFNDSEAIERTIHDYFKIREPRVDVIRTKAMRTKKQKSDLSWGMTMMMYAAIWVMSRVEWLMGFVWSDELHTWSAEDEVRKVMEGLG